MDKKHNNRYFLSLMARKAGTSTAQTKTALLDAAAEVFAANGFDGARVSEIARTAGLTTGAIYAHYENKSELLCEAISAHGSDALGELLAGEGGLSLTEAFEAIGADLPYESDEADALLAEAALAARRDPAVRRFLQAEVTRRELILSRLLDGAQRKGEVDATLPSPALARLVTTLALGTLVTKAISLDPPNHDDWKVIVHRLIQAIESEDAHDH